MVFGEAKSEDQSAVSQAAAAKQFQAQQAAAVPQVPGGAGGAAAGEDEEDDVPDLEEAVDETGMEGKDIELVMSQAGCSRAAAVKALKDNDGDLVNSIMSLTK